jgi:hypothetical protein
MEELRRAVAARLGAKAGLRSGWRSAPANPRRGQLARAAASTLE